MKNFTVLFLFFIIFILNLYSLDVSGSQSGTWSSTDNPINLVGDVSVPAGSQLTVESGAEIIASGNYKITVLGTISINGTQNDSVRFYGNNGLDWGGLRLENESEQSIIEYCRISNTDDNNDYAVHCINSPVLITNSYFDDHKKAVSFSGISTTNPASMTIRNSKISDCYYSGLVINDNSNAVVDSCEVTRCGLGTQYRGAIQLGLQSSTHSCSPQITNNWIHHNNKQGIIMSNIFGYEGMAPMISGNIIENNLTGVYFYSSMGIADNNVIRNNFITGDANSGAGVMLYGAMSQPVITNNQIYGNFTGFYLMAGASGNIGNLENASVEDDGFNYIHDNVDESGNVYAIVSISDATIYAQNNYWDSFDEADIAETIIDFGDDYPDAAGTVVFEPIAAPDLNPPTNLNVIVDTDSDLWSLTVTVNPPVESQFAQWLGYNLYLDGIVMEELFTDETINIDSVNPAIEIEIGVSAQYDAGESEVLEVIVENYVFKMPSFSYSLADSTFMLNIEVPAGGSSTSLTGYQIYRDGSVLTTTSETEIDLTDQFDYNSSFILGVSALYEGGYESDIYEESITFVDAEESILAVGGIRCYPNPFNPETRISFTLKETADAELVIFNIQGKKVRTLISSNLTKGYYEKTWKGLDNSGKPVASGLYFYRLKAGEDNYSGKMLMLK